MDPEGERIRTTNMDLEGERVRATADNMNSVIHVQQQWKELEKSEAAILKTMDKSLALKTRDQLQSFLDELENVKEVNPAVQKSRERLVQEITMFKDNIDLIVLQRKVKGSSPDIDWHDSYSEFTNDSDGPLLDSNSNSQNLKPGIEKASDLKDPTPISLGSKEIKTGNQPINSINSNEHPKKKKKRGIAGVLSNLFVKFTRCGGW